MVWNIGFDAEWFIVLWLVRRHHVGLGFGTDGIPQQQHSIGVLDCFYLH